MAAIDVMDLKHIIILQNKIDLIKEQQVVHNKIDLIKEQQVVWVVAHIYIIVLLVMNTWFV